MATAYIQMDTPFVLYVTPGKAETTTVTITKPPLCTANGIQRSCSTTVKARNF